VRQALVALGEDWPSAHVEPWKYDWAPEFYTFQSWRPGPVQDDGVSVLQTRYFAVNPWTGDVWDAMGCNRITSPAIQKEQKLIWKRSRLADEVRETLRNRSPAACSDVERKATEKKK